MNIIKVLEIISISSETTITEFLMEWMMSRGILYAFGIILCLFWAFYGSEDRCYEPPHITLKWDGKEDLVLRFDKSDLISRSIEEELWYRGIGRTLIQLDSIRKPVSPLWKSLDSLLNQWEQDLND